MSQTPTTSHGLLPLPLWIAFAVVLLAGAAIFVARPFWLEKATYEALNTCAAGVLKEEDGLNDAYGIINFHRNSGEIAGFLALCESNPKMALRIYRRAMKDGEKSAKLVAIHASFFLAVRGQLEKSDFEMLASRLDPEQEKDLDVRKAVQRRIAELLVLTNLAAKDKYEDLPANLPPVGEKDTPHRIQAREEGPEGKKVLRLRWSTPAAAWAWWKSNAPNGAWDAERGAYLIH